MVCRSLIPDGLSTKVPPLLSVTAYNSLIPG